MLKAFTVVLIAGLVVGCATSSKNLNKVRVGLTKAEVIQILGQPESTGANRTGEFFIYSLSERIARPGEAPAPVQILGKYFVKFVDGRVESFGRLSDFDSTKRFVQPNQLPDKSPITMGTSWPIALGYVVTNHHIIEGHEKITLVRPDGKKMPATVLVGDKVNDIVLLKVANPRELPSALPLAEVKPAIGSKVFTIGYPHPDILGTSPKLTDGLISSVSGFQDDPRTYQITVPLQAGNSGGPLLNLNGEVVGIVTSKIDAIRVFRWTGDFPQNVNYAIKISYLKILIDSVTAQSYPINELPKEAGDLEKLSKRIQDSMMIVLAE